MGFPHETYAKVLRGALLHRFSNVPFTRVWAEGGGVHWTCSAQCGGRLCSIWCFDLPGAEYLAAFTDDGREHATGRTSSQDDVVAAAGDWLDGASLEALYVRFSFIDRRKRALTALLAETLERSPRLRTSASHEVCQGMCDMYDLRFRAKDRACVVSYGKNRFTDGMFIWDERGVFQFPAEDSALFGEVLERWLCDDAVPSALAREFTGVQLGPLARYYEEGRPVEGEFLFSWDEVERYYGRLPSPSEKVLQLIADMRQAGYDKVLRAGTSLRRFVVSRSRRHGLRAGQPWIGFAIMGNGMDVMVSIEGEELFSGLEIAFAPHIDAMLKRLAERKID